MLDCLTWQSCFLVNRELEVSVFPGSPLGRTARETWPLGPSGALLAGEATSQGLSSDPFSALSPSLAEPSFMSGSNSPREDKGSSALTTSQVLG